MEIGLGIDELIGKGEIVKARKSMLTNWDELFGGDDEENESRLQYIAKYCELVGDFRLRIKCDVYGIECANKIKDTIDGNDYAIRVAGYMMDILDVYFIYGSSLYWRDLLNAVRVCKAFLGDKDRIKLNFFDILYSYGSISFEELWAKIDAYIDSTMGEEAKSIETAIVQHIQYNTINKDNCLPYTMCYRNFVMSVALEEFGAVNMARQLRSKAYDEAKKLPQDKSNALVQFIDNAKVTRQGVSAYSSEEFATQYEDIQFHELDYDPSNEDIVNIVRDACSSIQHAVVGDGEAVQEAQKLIDDSNNADKLIKEHFATKQDGDQEKSPADYGTMWMKNAKVAFDAKQYQMAMQFYETAKSNFEKQPGITGVHNRHSCDKMIKLCEKKLKKNK